MKTLITTILMAISIISSAAKAQGDTAHVQHLGTKQIGGFYSEKQLLPYFRCNAEPLPPADFDTIAKIDTLYGPVAAIQLISSSDFQILLNGEEISSESSTTNILFAPVGHNIVTIIDAQSRKSEKVVLLVPKDARRRLCTVNIKEITDSLDAK